MKSIFLKTFNQQFLQFLEDILVVFPSDVDIMNMKNTINTVKKFNPSMLIKMWYQYVWIPYSDQVMKDDISFFVEKNYGEDIKLLDENQKTIDAIERLRIPIRNLDEENQIKCMHYIKNLSLLSDKYMSSK
mgnify:FL=1|tara:strand:+ start:2091 stop:2483 length:393 start_codon:yes stop_codon:yes gene_type:complete